MYEYKIQHAHPFIHQSEYNPVERENKTVKTVIAQFFNQNHIDRSWNLIIWFLHLTQQKIHTYWVYSSIY